MAGKIFINYRRGLNRKDAQHLFTQLLLHFPRHRLFIDQKGLDNAPDWLHELERQVAQQRYHACPHRTRLGGCA